MWQLDYKKSWVLKNWCFWTVVLEKTLESPVDCKEIQPVHSKGDQSWLFIGGTDVETETNILATWCEELTHLRGPWCWERLKVGWEGDDRGWDGLIASPTLGTWVWVISRNWWYTGKPDMLLSMGPQRVGHDWVTEVNWIEGFLGSSDGKEPACNGGDLSLIPGREGPLEKEMATNSSILAWRFPWTEEPGRL